MSIPFFDLSRQYATIKNPIDTAIRRVLKKQFFVLGEEVHEFELEFAKYLNVKYFGGLNSGTDGLILSLLALGVKEGDEVITPVNTFVAVCIAILKMGATPVFVDINPDTYQLDIEEVKKKVTKRTKVIIPVHFYGAPCEIEELMYIASKNNIFVVEDASQAHGATYRGKKLGTFSDIGVFSFYPTKNLGAYGDAGGVCTNNKSLYQKLLKLRNYGESKKYYYDSLGINSRLDDIQAAVLRVKLRYLDRWNKKRASCALLYNEYLPNSKTQKIIKYGVSSYYIFALESFKRDLLQKYLANKGIKTLIHYPVPLHLQPSLKHLGYKRGDFPNAENVAKYVLSLPLFPEITKKEIILITDEIKGFFAKKPTK